MLPAIRPERWFTMRATSGCGAIAFLSGAILLGVSEITGFEGLRIAATILLVGAAICFAIVAARSSNTPVWLKRVSSLFSRTFAYAAVAVLLAPALIALIVSLANAVLGWSDSGSPTAAVGFLVGLSFAFAIGGAAATALAALSRRKPEAQSGNQQ